MRNVVCILTGLVVLSVSSLPAARAQEIGPVYVVTYLEVASPAIASTVTALKKYAGVSRKAINNLSFTALQRVDRPNQFVILAAWKDQRALNTYGSSEQTFQFRNTLKLVSIAGYDERLHRAVHLGSAQTGMDGVWAITHVDFIESKEDEGIEALKKLSEPSRRDIGNLRYDILRQTSRPNHLTLIETWKNIAALEAHEMAAHTKIFREQTLPMSVALYDQRLYRAINY